MPLEISPRFAIDAAARDALTARGLGDAFGHGTGHGLGIDIHDTKAGAKRFYAQYDEDWPSVFDPTGRIAKRFGADSAPVTFFLDRRHRIVAVVYAAGTLAQFNAAYRKTVHS